MLQSENLPIHKLLAWYEQNTMDRAELDSMLKTKLIEVKNAISKYCNVADHDLDDTEIQLQMSVSEAISSKNKVLIDSSEKQILSNLTAYNYFGHLLGLVVVLKKVGDQKHWSAVPRAQYSTLGPTMDLLTFTAWLEPTIFWRGVDLKLYIPDIIWPYQVYTDNWLEQIATGDLNVILKSNFIDINIISYKDKDDERHYIGGSSFKEVYKNLMTI